jgi:hypothetical protein
MGPETMKSRLKTHNYELNAPLNQKNNASPGFDQGWRL